MAKRLNESPTIADQIVFDILTPDADNCFSSDPYKVDNVKIYYVSRDFSQGKVGSYEKEIIDASVLSQLEEARKTACASPTKENLNEVIRLENKLEQTTKTNEFFYDEAVPVGVFGTEDFPAWLSTDLDNAMLTHVTEDDDGNTQYGHFELEWEPKGLREGDYFICWTWTPNPAGNSLCAHTQFTLLGATQLTTSIPTHYTDPKKYPTLLDRYTPEIYKLSICQGDLTAPVVEELNKSVAKGFQFTEDMVNQVQDLLDANSTHESILMLLGNLFNIKLKTGDPTLWRRQIKRAIPLYKRKGTYDGLVEALDQAAIKLERFVKMWQVVSDYTYQELFDVEEDGQESFELSRTPILPIDANNFELYYRAVDSTTWETLNSDYVSVSLVGGVPTAVWLGDGISTNPVSLSLGDSVRMVYQAAEIPGATEQTLEDYIRTLPLGDQRDERSVEYPVKNWNVRVIEEDDPMFDAVIGDRHPYFDPLVFGKVRTEFPFSENIYNMEEYNGSKRDSTDPCDIDRDFVDPCHSCLGSKYVVDLQIDNLSNDRILEAQEVLKEFLPFHAVMHSMNFSGGINEFVQSPVEDIEILTWFVQEDFTLSGSAQTIFNRTMEMSAQARRDELASSSTVVATASGTGTNDKIVLLSPDEQLSRLPIDKDDSSLTFLEVLSPHANAGEYNISEISNRHATVTKITGSISESPLNQTAFTFRLSNEKVRNATTSITQDDLFFFSDEETDFGALGTKSQWDIDQGLYGGSPWQIEITSSGGGTFDILEILPDGSLILDDPTDALPTVDTSDISFNLLNDSAETKAASTTGSLEVTRRGRVDMSPGTILVRGTSGTIDDIRNFVDIGNYFLVAGTQYEVLGFVSGDTHEFYIEGYSGGDVTGVNGVTYQRIIDEGYGLFHYKGITLTTLVDQEAALSIQNGVNPPTTPVENDSYKENFLILIDSDYYAIEEIDGTTITLAGPLQDWSTSTAGGTAVSYDIVKFEKEGLTVPEREEPYMPGYTFDTIDRRGGEVIEIVTETATPMFALATALNASKNGEVVDNIGQEESISFSIEWAEGEPNES